MLSPCETLMCFEPVLRSRDGSSGTVEKLYVCQCKETQETRFQSLGWKDSLEEEMATCSSKNPMDRGTWWAIVHEVAKSQTWLSAQTHTHIQHIEFYLEHRIHSESLFKKILTVQHFEKLNLTRRMSPYQISTTPLKKKNALKTASCLFPLWETWLRKKLKG